ncbi:MAG: hypothetical protein WCB49_03725 [Gammaproteobacteria bacterium]
MIAEVPTREAESINDTVFGLLVPLSEHVYTITSNNGKEFARHGVSAGALNVDF